MTVIDPRPRRVLQLNKDYSGTGAQKVSLYVMQALDDHEFIFCAETNAAQSDAFRSKVESRAVKAFDVHGLTNRSSWRLPLTLYRVCAIVRDNDVDLIHTHSFVAGIVGRLAGLITGIPVVHTFHGLPSERHQRAARRLIQLVERTLIRITGRAVFVNPGHMALVARTPDAKSRSMTLFNPVPEMVRKPAVPLNERVHCHGTRLLFIGRFTHQKNPELYIEVVRRLRRTGMPLQARMVGAVSDQELSHYQRLAGTDVTVERFSERSQEVIDWADIVVLPSRYEALPLVIGEALTRGKGVVASNVDGLEDIWGRSVCFAREGSPEDFVDKISRFEMIRRELDDGSTVLAAMSSERFEAGYRAVYDDLLRLTDAA